MLLLYYLSAISHAWQCLTVEPERQRGKIWRLFFVVLVSIDFLFLLMNNNLCLHAHKEEVVSLLVYVYVGLHVCVSIEDVIVPSNTTRI